MISSTVLYLNLSDMPFLVFILLSFISDLDLGVQPVCSVSTEFFHAPIPKKRSDSTNQPTNQSTSQQETIVVQPWTVDCFKVKSNKFTDDSLPI